MKTLSYIKIGVALLVVVLVVGGFFWLRNLTRNDHLDFGTDNEIDITPTQIQSIKAIGEFFVMIRNRELLSSVKETIHQIKEQ